MKSFAAPPIEPMLIEVNAPSGTLQPSGPILERRMSNLPGLFAREDLRRAASASDDPLVYSVASSPVPEADRELPQSITTIQPGHLGGELFMTKGHQHPDAQGEIYLALGGSGGILLFDGDRSAWIAMREGAMGYIPPGWAHRSVNTGPEAYRFLAVYPGSAGHDYQWVLDHGMGQRAFAGPDGVELRPFARSAG